MIETVNGVSASAERAAKITDKTIEKMLAFAQPQAAYSAPVVSGAYTIITASEVLGGGGFGYGSGPATAASEGKPRPAPQGDGGGGGGGFHSRPVAAIVIGPNGVKVQPIADGTKIAIAAISAWAGVALTAIRIARAAKSKK